VVPEYVLQVGWIGGVEVFPVEHVVANISTALEIVPTWPRQAPVHMPTSLGVLIDEGGCSHHEVG
jgi:hypothetical protein